MDPSITGMSQSGLVGEIGCPCRTQFRKGAYLADIRSDVIRDIFQSDRVLMTRSIDHKKRKTYV